MMLGLRPVSIARNSPLKALRVLEAGGLEMDELGGFPRSVEWTNPDGFIPRDVGEIDEMIRHIHGQYADKMKWAIEELQGSLYAALAKHEPTQVVKWSSGQAVERSSGRAVERSSGRAVERLTELEDNLREQMIDAMSRVSSVDERADFLWRSGLREPFSKEQKYLIYAMVSNDQYDQYDPFSIQPSISKIDPMVKWINAIESPDVRRELIGEAPNIPVNDVGGRATVNPGCRPTVRRRLRACISGCLR